MPHMFRPMLLTAVIASVAGFSSACGPDATPDAQTPVPSASQAVTAVPEPIPSATAVVEAPPVLPPVDLVPGNPATPPDKAPTVAIKSPSKDQLIAADKAADFDVKLDVKGWDNGGGSHVHLILDGHPYKRIDKFGDPIKLGSIDPNYTLAEGQHVLAAFPSRHTHESVKPIGKAVPLAVVSFYVGKKKTPATWKPTDPTLIFSRPKGANNGPPPPDGILVDFYLANVELGDGKFSVQATVTGPGLESGKTVTIKEWKPWRITNPRDGSYQIHLALMDKDNKAVPGAWNDVTRSFTVDSKAEPDHMAPPPPDAAPAGSATPATTPAKPPTAKGPKPSPAMK